MGTRICFHRVPSAAIKSHQIPADPAPLDYDILEEGEQPFQKMVDEIKKACEAL